MDLIERGAAIETLGEPHPLDYNRISAVEKVRGLPSVDAVPLDKLCEWLARSALFNTGYRVKIGASMWKELIKREVMEELHGRSD